MRKRKHVVSFHLSAKELRHLETQTTLSGLNREEFLRTLIMGAELRARPCEHHAELLRKISGLQYQSIAFLGFSDFSIQTA